MRYFLFVHNKNCFIVNADTFHEALYWATEFTEETPVHFLSEISSEAAQKLPYIIY